MGTDRFYCLFTGSSARGSSGKVNRPSRPTPASSRAFRDISCLSALTVFFFIAFHASWLIVFSERMESLLDIKVAPFTGKRRTGLCFTSEPEFEEKMIKLASSHVWRFIYSDLTCFSFNCQGDKRLYDPRRRLCKCEYITIRHLSLQEERSK